MLALLTNEASTLNAQIEQIADNKTVFNNFIKSSQFNFLPGHECFMTKISIFKIYNFYDKYIYRLYMEINNLKYFYLAAKLGGVSKASKELRVSQPSVTKMIRNLEHSLDVKLFKKAGRNIELTVQGKVLYEHTIKIFNEIEQASEHIQEVDRKLKGTIQIGVSDNIANYFLPKTIATFAKSHPEVNFNIFTGTSIEIKRKLLNQEIRFAFFYTPLSEEEKNNLSSQKIAEIPFTLVMSAKAKNTPDRFSKKFLETQRYIGSRHSDYSRKFPAQLIHEELGLKTTSYIQTNNQETQKKLVLANLGYTIIPRHVVEDEINRGILKELKTEIPLKSRIYCVELKNFDLNKLETTFKEEILKNF